MARGLRTTPCVSVQRADALRLFAASCCRCLSCPARSTSPANSPLLQGVVVRWGELSAAQQRAVFGAAMVVAGNAAWDWLELALHLALKRAAG